MPRIKKEKSEKIEKQEKEKKKAKAESQKIDSGQPELNIGLVGQVDSGKTTLTHALSGKWTDTHSEELKRGITIRLGYADVIFYKCEHCKEENYTTSQKCNSCNKQTKFLRKVSFIDAPGHESLMATMLSGAAIMDGAILVIAANEECPQPQTKEHLMALEITGVKNIVIAQNKIDLASEEDALKNYHQIKNFIKGTIAENAPIIPVSAQHKINLSSLIEAIENIIKTPAREKNKDPIVFVARSFDINKPGTEIKDLVGGVLGGALKQGILRKGDKIEIRPGQVIEKESRKIWKPIITEIVDIKTGGFSVNEVSPGGSIGVLTKLDPFYVKADSLSGNVVGHAEKLPEVFYEFNFTPKLLERVVGTKEDLKVDPIKNMESLMLNVNSAATVGVVTDIKKNVIHVKLKIPVCCNKEDRITISRLHGNRWRLIGYGKII